MDAKHPASDKKRRKLRLQGDVASVQDLCLPFALLGFLLSFWGMAPRLGKSLLQIFSICLSSPGPQEIPRLQSLAANCLISLTVIVIGTSILGAILPWAIGGFLWAPARLGGGLKPRVGVQLSRAWGLLGTLILACSGCVWIAGFAKQLATESTPMAQAMLVKAWVTQCVGWGVGLVVAVGIAKFFWERRQYEMRIQMSEEEKRREQMEDNGSPVLRSQRDKMQAELLGGAPASSGAAQGMVTMGGPEGPSA